MPQLAAAISASDDDASVRLIRDLDYLILPCTDLPAMRRFYQDELGFALYRDRFEGRWIELRAGSVLLTLRQRHMLSFGGVSADAVPRGLGANVQLAFRVAPGEVDACHRALVRRGIPVLDPPKDQQWGHRTVFFNDPEGNLVEIYADL